MEAGPSLGVTGREKGAMMLFASTAMGLSVLGSRGRTGREPHRPFSPTKISRSHVSKLRLMKGARGEALSKLPLRHDPWTIRVLILPAT